VAKGGSLLEDWTLKVKFLDDGTRAEVEIISHDANKVVVVHAFLYCTIGVDMDGKRVSNSNSVRYLHEHSMCKAIGNERLGNISSEVGGRSVDLRGVLSREGTTSMRAPSTVGIDNNLSSSETSVSSGSTEAELAGGVDDNLGVNEHLLWNDLVDDLFDKLLTNLFIGDRWVMLGGNEDIVDSNWLHITIGQLLVLNDNLRLAVRSQPRKISVLSLDGHFLAKHVGEDVRVRMEGLGVPFVCSITEHQSLITSAHVHLVLVGVYSISNLRALHLGVDDHLAVVAVNSDFLTCEPNLLQHSSGNLLEVDLGLVDGNFSKQNNL